MELTGRQKDFMWDFLTFYRQEQTALHYTDVARHLGVSKITAYDMLRLLEERGLVQSEYVFRGERQRGGRSSIVFRPTPRADALLQELAGEPGSDQAWEAAKAQILETLRDGRRNGYQGIAEEMLARLPSRQSPMLYAAEMITATLLSLRRMQERASAGLTPLGQLDSLGILGEAGLSALGGLAVGLSFAERLNRSMIGQLLACQGRYQEIVSGLSDVGKQRLVDLAKEIVKAIDY